MKKKQTVLIVDDISDNLNVAANILIREQINVLLALKGSEAISTAKKMLPDLILLDIMMPEMDGFEICKILKGNEETKNIPVIFLTAKNEKESIAKGFEIGAVDYVTKPFHLEELLARVKTHLSISEMRKKIENANLILEQEVVERTTELSSTNRELKQNNEQLEIAKEKAEESDRLKTSFLNSISHEIRTPMNGIIGFANLLIMPNLSTEDQKLYVDTILESSEQLMKIVTDIITISTIHAGQEKISRQDNIVDNILSKAINPFKAEAKSKEISLKNPLLGDTSLKIYTDGLKLEQILTKLLSNAIKYTHKGNVECAYTIKGEKIEFYVKDTGIGVSPKMHEYIFEQFRQVETKLARNYGGTGLGLSIAKAYVDLLEGDIWLESELDKGSTFYFSIPYKR